MSVKEVSNFLKDKQFRPSKKLGQNFLINPQIKQRIVNAANLQPKDIVLEIGPGVGAITSILLTHKIKLIAIEVDKRLAELLTTKLKTYNNFILYNIDALKVDWDKILFEYTQSSDVKLVANLPYSISSLLVLKIIRSQLISQATIMVQKEMADRLCAKVGTHAYNMFTILVQLFLDVQKLFDVDPSNFSPKPKVQSCVIQLTKKQPVSDLYDISDFEVIDNFLHLAFSNKRKTLVNNLIAQYDKSKILNVLQQIQLPSMIRAEQINPCDLIKIMKALNND